MSEYSDFNDENLKEKIKILLDEDNQIKKWNQGLFVKGLILLPSLIFIIGLFIINKPETIIDVLFIFLYPFALISIGLVILFLMRSKVK